MAPTARSQLTLVRVPDRRNHFARESLRREVSGQFANCDLVTTAAGAAQRFQLPLPLCERLLEELVSAGALTRSSVAYSSSGQRMRLVPPLTRRHAVTTPRDPLAPIRIVRRIAGLADRLGEGSVADHLRRSVRELSLAVEQGMGVGPAVERVMSSVRQLHEEQRAGCRRHAREGQVIAERLLNTVQQELLAVLQRSGHI